MTCADAQTVTHALGGRWHGAYGTACCPAHDDRSPSLSLKDGRDGRLLAYCHAGCDWRDVRDALRGLGHLPGRGEAPAPVDPAVREAREREEPRGGRAPRRSGPALLAGHPAPRGHAGGGLPARPRDCGAPALRPCASTPPAGTAPPRAATPPWSRASRAPSASRCTAPTSGATGAGSTVDDAARREDAKMMLGHTLGGAVRLAGREGPPRGARGTGSSRGPGPLVVAEGIETALSVASGAAGPLGPGARVWAALAAGHLAGLRLPAWAGRLVIAADGDEGGRTSGPRAGRAGAGRGVAGDGAARPRGAGLERRADGGGRGVRRTSRAPEARQNP